jgi:HSP20 family protein
MVMRWDPFSEALSLRDAMNRLFEQAVLRPGEGARATETGGYAPPMDVHEDQDGYTIKVSLPGVKPEDVDIQWQQGMLTVSGQTSAEETREQGTWHVRERRQGRFSRSISLPDAVSADKAEASFENGVLKLHLPKAEETKPRSIQIQGVNRTSTTPEIEGSQSAGNGSRAGVGMNA